MRVLLSVLALVMVLGCGLSATATSTAIAPTAPLATPTAAAAPATPATTATAETIVIVVPAATATTSEELQTDIKDFLAKGNQVVTLDSSGVTYLPFGAAVGDVFSAYDKIDTDWPSGTHNAGLLEARQALLGWTFAKQLWGAARNGEVEPTEPNDNNYAQYVAYAGGNLVIAVRDQNFSVPADRGKHYLPYDADIPALMTKGNQYFTLAQAALQEFLK